MGLMDEAVALLKPGMVRAVKAVPVGGKYRVGVALRTPDGVVTCGLEMPLKDSTPFDLIAALQKRRTDDDRRDFDKSVYEMTLEDL